MAVSPLFPALRPIHGDDDGRTTRSDLPEGTLVLASAAVCTARLVQLGVTSVLGGWPRRWAFAHDRAGAPRIQAAADMAPAISVAATGCTRALLIGTGPLGIDVETLDRIALNGRIDDDWLAPSERALLSGLSLDQRRLELTCRWVLREAYGKASGRGLDLPLARFAFTVRSGVVRLPASVIAEDSWTFSLHRRGRLVVGIVAAGSAG